MWINLVVELHISGQAQDLPLQTHIQVEEMEITLAGIQTLNNRPITLIPFNAIKNDIKR